MASPESSLESLTEPLVAACRLIGTRAPLWSQGTNGSVSFKEKDALWIKSPAVRFDQVERGSGLEKASLTELRGAASHEADLHALLPAKWVAHFRSLVGVLMAEENHHDPGALKQWLAKFWSGGEIVLVAHGTGFQALDKTLARNPQAEIFVIPRHGVILQTEDELVGVNGLLSEWIVLEKKFCQHFGYADLLTLHASASPLTAALELLRESPPENGLQALLPDFAIQKERLLALLDAEGCLRQDAWEKDRDVAELWVALQILAKAW